MRNYFFYGLIFLIVPHITQGQLIADFSLVSASGCSPFIISATRTDLSPGVTSYWWDLGKTGSTPIYNQLVLSDVYPDPGQYTLRLTISNGVQQNSKEVIITVYQSPKANFTADSMGCTPYTVKFSDNSVLGDAAINKWEWDFKDGTTSSLPAPSKVYSEIRQYGVFLKVTDANNCFATKNKDNFVEVFPQPLVSFTSDKQTNCGPPLNVQFVNTSFSHLPLNYIWDFGDGKSSSAFAPSHSYNASGVFTVKLTGSNTFNCNGSASISSYINLQSVKADFEVLQNGKIKKPGDTLCLGEVTMRSKVVGASSINWLLFEPNVHFTGDSVVFTNNTSGAMTIYMGIKLNDQCGDTLTQKFYVEGAQASFTLDTAWNCQYPLTVKASSQLVNINSFEWLLDDSLYSTSKNPVFNIVKKDTTPITEPTTFNHIITLKASSNKGCIFTRTKNVSIEPLFAAFKSNTKDGCVPLDVIFTNQSMSDSAQMKWITQFETFAVTPYQETSNFTFPDRGDYDVRLILTNEKGCTDTSEIVVINAGDQMTVDFTVSPASVCSNETISLVDKSSNSSIVDSWDFESDIAHLQTECSASGSITVGIKPDKSGFVPISLTVEDNGCFTEGTKANALFIKGPVGSFKPMIDCDFPRKFKFEGSIFDATQIDWDFGDGNIASALTAPEHTYDTSGDYRVILSLNNPGNGCQHSDTQWVMARKPYAHLYLKDDYEKLCANVPLVFYADSSRDNVDSCTMQGFEWYFSDDSSYRLTRDPLITHTFTKKGSYPIHLKVIDVNGCKSFATLLYKNKPIEIHQPELSFSVNKERGCVPVDSFIFTNTTTDGTVIDWRWSFAGVWSDSMKNIVDKHLTATQTSLINVILEVTDSFTCKNTSSKSVELYQPNSDFIISKPGLCLGEMISFSRAFTGLDSVFWNLGDGTQSKTDGSHLYATRGKYDVSMIAYHYGCIDTTYKDSVISVQLAVADFSTNDTILDCYPALVNFTHSTPPDPAVEGRWIYGDGINATNGYSKNASFTYTKPGIYPAQLFMKTSNGCVDTATLPITVRGPYAEMQISPLSACTYSDIKFRIVKVQNVADFRWFFGDGNNAKDSFPVHQYSNGGNYIPSLWLKDEKGCEPPNVIGSKITIAQVNASFVFNDTTPCVGQSIEITNTTTGATRFNWNTGYSTSTKVKPAFSFVNPGEYSIELIAQSSLGCVDTLTKPLQVYPLPQIMIGGPDSICIGENALLNVSTNDALSIFHWEPKDYFINDSISNPEITPSQSMMFYAHVLDAKGCEAKDSLFIYVQQFPNVLSPDTIRIAIGGKVSLDASSTYPTVYSWTPNQWMQCNDCPIAIVQPLEDITYHVVRMDKCFETENDYILQVVDRYTIDVPTVFTPNGDGVNDIVYVRGFGIKQMLEFTIYNRWGNKVFSSDNIDEGWDGTFAGKPQSSDSYVYYVRVILYENDAIKEKRGTITLLK